MAGLYAWEFEKGGHELKVRVEGPARVQHHRPEIERGAGRAAASLICRRIVVRTHVAEGRLNRVLADWCAPFSGYHLYYPSRRQPTPAFALLVDALRYRG